MKKNKKRFSCHFVRKSEAKAVAAIHSEAFMTTTAKSVKEKVDSKTEGAMVAKNRKGAIVGYIFFDIEKDNTMYVANVGVHKKHRGKGVCGRMIKWLMKRLPKFDCKSAYLSVARDNDHAKACYTSRGFVAKEDVFMIRMEYWPAGAQAAIEEAKASGDDATAKGDGNCAPCENVASVKPRLTGLSDDTWREDQGGWGE